MKKLLISILITAFCLQLSACSDAENSNFPTDTSNNNNPKSDYSETITIDFSEYKDTISKFNDDVYELSVLLANIGRYQVKFWEILGRADYSKMVSGGFEWLEKEEGYTQSQIESDCENIKNLYKEIIKINIDLSDTVAKESNDKLLDMFDNFNSLYLLITSPSGSLSDFKESFNEYVGNIRNLNSSLSILVSD